MKNMKDDRSMNGGDLPSPCVPSILGIAVNWRS